MKYCIPFLLALLIGCTTQSPTKLPPVTTAEAPPSEWSIRGKLGVRSTSRNGSLAIRWQQQADAYQIRVNGPLGQGAASIEGNSFQVTIEQAGKEPLTSFTPEALFVEVFGWHFPLRHLNYWVLGLPHPDSPSDPTYSADGTLAQLQQAGWTLTFDRYQQQQQWALPGRIRARQGDLALTLLIRQWQLPAQTASTPY